MRWQQPFRLVPDDEPVAPGERPYEYVPRFDLIAAHLVAVAEVVLAATPGPVGPESVLHGHAGWRHEWTSDGYTPPRLDSAQDAEHLLQVLEQADVVGPADDAGRRPVLVGGSQRQQRKALTKVKAVAHVAAQLAAGA